MVKHLTKVACLALLAGLFYALPTTSSAETVYLADFASTTVIEAENYSWNAPNSENATFPRAWILGSVGGSVDTKHPRTSQTNFDARINARGGPSGDYLFVSNEGTSNTAHLGRGDEDPPNLSAGVGWLVKFTQPGRYFMLPRILTTDAGNSNRAKWQFDWAPANDANSPVFMWGRNQQAWVWDPGPNIHTPNSPGNNGGFAVYVDRPGTYWLRAYHSRIGFAVDQIALIPWPVGTIPYVPANTDAGGGVKLAETAKVAVSSNVSAARTFGASSYVAGGAAVPVTLTLTVNAAGDVVTTETLPLGFTAANVVASTGTATVISGGNEIVWAAPGLVTGGAAKTLTYDAVPGATACGNARWLGVHNGIPIESNQMLAQAEGAGDGIANAPIAWDGTYDIRPTGANTAARWFACGNRYELVGSGEDIWGANDEMRVVGMYVSGDCSIAATVDFLRPPNIPDANAKVGVFIRDNNFSGAAGMNAIIRRDGRIAAQFRDVTGGASADTSQDRNPNKISSARVIMNCVSTANGSTLTVGIDTFEENVGNNIPNTRNGNTQWPYSRFMANVKSPYFIGLGVTAHRPDAERAVARGVFTNVTATGTPVDVAAQEALRDLPTTFTAGALTQPITVKLLPLNGGGGAVVTTETLPAGWVVNSGSATAGSVTFAGNVLVWTIADMPNTTATLTYDATVAANACRTNPVFSGVFGSGGEVVSVGGETSIAWLAYDAVARRPLGLGDNGIAAAGLGLQHAALDSPTLTGYSLFYACDQTFVLYASGGDIWGQADAGEFCYAGVRGNFTLSATVQILIAPDYWTKAGLMVRDNLTAGSPNALIMLRGDNNGANPPEGIRAQVRYNQNGDSGDTGAPTDQANNSTATLTISRDGTTVTLGFDNHEGVANPAWKRLSLPNISNACVLGFVLTSHNNGLIGAASYRNVAVTATPYAPTIGPGTRAFAGGVTTATPGTPIGVTLTIPHLANASTVTVVENLPAGSIAMGISNGGRQVGNTVVWNIVPFNANATLTYTFLPQIAGNPYAPYVFSGSTASDELGWVEPIANSLLTAGGTFVLQQGVSPDPSYAGTRDTFIIENTPDSNQGGNDGLEEGDWDGGLNDHKKTMIAFDIPALPAGFTADKVLLSLYNHDERRADIHNARVLNVQRLLKQWGEGTGGGYDGPTATAGQSSWNNAQVGSLAWELPGAMGNTDAGPIITSNSVSGAWPMWVTFDVTQSAMDMMTTPAQNFGWKISQDKLRGVLDATPGNEYVQGAYDYISRNNGNTGLRPQLIFVNSAQLYQPTIASASRTVGAWQWGDDVNVSIQVTAAAAGTSIALTEVLPAGWTVVSIANGGVETSPGVIRWHVAPWTMAGVTVSYVATTAAWPQVPVAGFTGGDARDNAGAAIHVPDSYVKHAGVTVLQQGVWPDATYAGTADTFILIYQSNSNAGGNSTIEEGDWGGGGGDHKKILIKFDLPGTMTAADVTSAQLLLFYDFQRRGDIAGDSHAIFTQKVLKQWGEGVGVGTDGAAALDGEATFNAARHNQLTWETAGAMGATDVGPLFTQAGSGAFGTVQDTWIALNVTKDVQDFLATPADNNGWKVSQDRVIGLPDNDPRNGYAAGAFNFVSSEGGAANLRPMLVIWTPTAVPVEVGRFMLY